MVDGDLSGIRIVDFSPTVGALATSALADMGADVVHVGRPPGGGNAEPVGRNKRSIALDLKDPRGREIAHALVRGADAVVEGFRPGVAARLGIGYDNLRAINEGIVYCSLSGFGQTGPYRAWPGHDLNYQGVAGSVEFDADGRPVMPSGPWSDRAAGYHLQIAILRGLLARERTGRGRYFDVALVDATATIPLAEQYCVAGVGRMPTGGMSGSSLPKTPMIRGDYCWYGMYECADGRWLSLGCLEPRFWLGLCGAIGHPEWEPWQFDEARQPEMRAALSEWLRTRDRGDWLELLAVEHDLPVAPVHRAEEAASDAHLRHRGSFVDAALPNGRIMRQIGSPFRGADETRIWRPMTVSGMDTTEVLTELGWDAALIARLEADGVVRQTRFPAAVQSPPKEEMRSST